MAATKKIPLRMCCGCSQMKPKKELVRIVKSSEGEVSIDCTGKKSGRGAYICRNTECFELARKSRRFEKSLSCKISDDVYEVMKNELAKSE